jgi:lipopolysaccharide transport system ATP-binding protein
MKPIIEIRNVSKKYSLGEKQSYYSLRDSIYGLFRNPFEGRLTKKNEFWALKDVSLNVAKGEVLGIIGPNGAGKSTLLKILSKITPPTKGEILLRGRVSSLLEVGTGFHPELTGRENIYLNGAILGMRRWEINKKFNEIVQFAEIEKFLDMPVKHYSSGMYMRLAFSIAAHLEPEILIIDEVLAVGDSAFQKKCLGKMNEVSKKDGRTVLFVSHNMGAIASLCQSCILLEEGEISINSSVQTVIDEYVNKSQSLTSISIENRKDRSGNGNIKISDLKITNSSNNRVVKSFDKLKIAIDLLGPLEKYNDLQIIMGFYDIDGKGLFRIDTGVLRMSKLDNPKRLVINTGKLNLVQNSCNVNIALYVDGQMSDYIANAINFVVHENQIADVKLFDRSVSTLLVETYIENLNDSDK